MATDTTRDDGSRPNEIAVATNDQKTDVKIRVLTENTAQGVLKHLREFESNRARVLSRWIWELLQNARDASSDGDLVASVERKKDQIVFLHNGRGFREEEIAHLIYHGSTKPDNGDAVGKFGSGFLTTHLLAPEIGISGRLDEGLWFDFPLIRKSGSLEALQRSMDDAWKAFNPSRSPTDRLPKGFSTRFRYPISLEDNKVAEVVNEGIATLKRCAPFVVVFNSQFDRIRIDDLGKTTEFQVSERRKLNDLVKEVTVIEHHDGNDRSDIYLLAEDDEVEIALQVKIHDGRRHCVVSDAAKLFLGFPLVGTECFSLPAVTNSFQFSPTEPRDGVFLGQSDNKENQHNERLINAACKLHIELMLYAAENGYHDIATLATIPPIMKQNWLDDDWLRKELLDGLVQWILDTPSVLSSQSAPLPPKKAILPCAKDEKETAELWRLLGRIDKLKKRLPSSPGEAEGWRNAAESWKNIDTKKTFVIDEELLDADEEEEWSGVWIWGGLELAHFVHSETKEPCEDYGKLDHFDTLLDRSVDAVHWLDDLCSFLVRSELVDELERRNLVLGQGGFLDILPNLHRDKCIDEELKHIADDLLDIGLRQKLRDKRIKSLSGEPGKGDLENKDVVRQILEKLREQARKKGSWSEKHKEASARLLAWMLAADRIDDVRDFPVCAETHGEEAPDIIWLGHEVEKSELLPLAPIQAWPEGLREFSDIFPRNRTLAACYFTVLPKLDRWKALEEKEFLRTDVLLQRSEDHDFADSPPCDPLLKGEDHVSLCPVEVVDVAYFVSVMSRASDSPNRAVLLWRFLTEYLIPRDPTCLDKKEETCKCGKEHTYYRAAWLKPLAQRKWVPLGQNKQRSPATASSLAKLLRNDGAPRGNLCTNADAVKLLNRLGITPLEWTMEFLASDVVKSNLHADLAKILESTGGNLAPVNQFIEDIKSDERLQSHLDERRDRRKKIRQNQKLGERVEELVKETLQEEGFTVERTGIGSDYEIEYDVLSEDHCKEVGIKVRGGDRTWLVEVKATREVARGGVRMTATQAKTAVREDDQFLLCVVPVKSGDAELEKDDIRDAMRFVSRIGQHLAPLCRKLDDLGKLRDDATMGDSKDVRLEIDAGKAWICVDYALWSNGIALADLVATLQNRGTT